MATPVNTHSVRNLLFITRKLMIRPDILSDLQEIVQIYSVNFDKTPDAFLEWILVFVAWTSTFMTVKPEPSSWTLSMRLFSAFRNYSNWLGPAWNMTGNSQGLNVIPFTCEMFVYKATAIVLNITSLGVACLAFGILKNDVIQ